MTRTLIGIPLRIGRRGAGLAVNATVGVAQSGLSWVAHLAGAVLDRDKPDMDVDGTEHRREPERPGPGRRTPAQRPAAGDAPAPAEAAAPSSEARAVQDAGARAAAAEPAPEELPAHVSEEPVLVDEVAEAGAEDGAGAQIRIEEPWEGYREMTAADVIDRINGADAAVLAAVELYEISARRRRTVVDAVRRELARAGRDQ
jgi:hypothetical protein